jgi:single-strand DNA-binding protein
MYQKLIIVGNLGRDPELRYTPDGTPVTNFSMAVNRKWTNADGSENEEVTWFRIVAWRRLAETCAQYLAKGRQVLVEGILRPDPATGGPRIWTGNDGITRASFEVNARNVRFLGGPRTERDDGYGMPPEEEEIPF